MVLENAFARGQWSNINQALILTNFFTFMTQINGPNLEYGLIQVASIECKC